MRNMRVMAASRLRREPGLDGKTDDDVIRILSPGTTVLVVGESVQSDGLTWWPIRSNGSQGWTAESSPDGKQMLGEPEPENELSRAMAFVFRWEGGYTNDTSDPGRETNMGISRRSHPEEDIKNMTVARATQIYEEGYWLAAGCNRLTWPLNLFVFDFAVNAGVTRARMALDQCDGNPARYNEIRRRFYRGLRQFDLYGAGWLRRVDDLEQEAARV